MATSQWKRTTSNEDGIHWVIKSGDGLLKFGSFLRINVSAAQSDKEIGPYKTVFDMSIPIGDRKQVHGEGVGRRDVFMTLAPQDLACRIIAGYTWGQQGMWIFWPPHQHEEHLEEVYVYFEMPKNQFGLNLVFNEDLSDFYAHKVESGDLVAMPNGYRPTVATPGVKNTYLWALFAHGSAKDRRYDLAQMHPNIG